MSIKMKYRRTYFTLYRRHHDDMETILQTNFTLYSLYLDLKLSLKPTHWSFLKFMSSRPCWCMPNTLPETKH